MCPLTCDAVELAVKDFLDGGVSDDTLQTIDKVVEEPRVLQVVRYEAYEPRWRHADCMSRSITTFPYSAPSISPLFKTPIETLRSYGFYSGAQSG